MDKKRFQATCESCGHGNTPTLRRTKYGISFVCSECMTINRLRPDQIKRGSELRAGEGYRGRR